MHTRTKPSMRLLAGAAALLSCVAAAAAGAPAAAQPPASVAAIIAPPARPVPTAAEVMAQRDLASSVTMSGDFRAARREWLRTGRMQRARGELPIEPLRMLAELDHALGREAIAAATLEYLGEAARKGGNVRVSAQAFLDAASLYRNAGMTDRARRCLEQAELLLHPAALDAERRTLPERSAVPS